MASLTAFADVSDGYLQNISTVYATARDGGGTFAADASAGVTIVGQVFNNPSAGDYSVFQSFFSFDTSSIGLGKVTAVTFSLKGSADVSTTDFVMELYPYDWGTTMDNGDWRTAAQLGALTRVASLNTSAYSTSYMDFTSDAAFVNNINTQGGYTRLILASSRQRTGTAPTGNEYILPVSADAAGTGDDPKLVITYTPAVPRATLINQSVQRASFW